jgi:hypothetical protein
MNVLEYNKLRIGNWLIDSRDGNYCVVTSTSPKLIVERYLLGRYEAQFSYVKGVTIIRDNLSLAEFQLNEGLYERTINNIHLVIVARDNNLFHWWVNEIFTDSFTYIHELQNAFQDATGILLELNLVGSK